MTGMRSLQLACNVTTTVINGTCYIVGLLNHCDAV